MNDERINSNKNDINDAEFDTLVQKITKHSINKKHSKERLNNIVAFALEENRNFEKARKTAFVSTSQKIDITRIQEFFKKILGWGRPKVLIPRLAFIASIIIIVTISVFYLVAPDEKELEVNSYSNIPTETNTIKENEAKPSQIEKTETDKMIIKENKIKELSSREKNNYRKEKKYQDISKIEFSNIPPHNEPALGQKNINTDNASPKISQDVPLIETNRGFQYLKKDQDTNVDTILKSLIDTERGMDTFGAIMGTDKEINKGLNFARYKQILLKYNINSVEENNELISDWFVVKSKNNNIHYHRLLFKINTQDPSKILIIKEDAHQISDPQNLKILTEKDFNRILELLK